MKEEQVIDFSGRKQIPDKASNGTSEFPVDYLKTGAPDDLGDSDKYGTHLLKIFEPLTDGELKEAGAHLSNPLSIKREVAKAVQLTTLKQVVKWLNNPCPHIASVEPACRYECLLCWDDLKAEIERMEKGK